MTNFVLKLVFFWGGGYWLHITFHYANFETLSLNANMITSVTLKEKMFCVYIRDQHTIVAKIVVNYNLRSFFPQIVLWVWLLWSLSKNSVAIRVMVAKIKLEKRLKYNENSSRQNLPIGRKNYIYFQKDLLISYMMA